jgi:hypothetical protein
VALTRSRERSLDKFIPVRKEDLFDAAVKQGEFADTAECEMFGRFARTLRTVNLRRCPQYAKSGR